MLLHLEVNPRENVSSDNKMGLYTQFVDFTIYSPWKEKGFGTFYFDF